MIWIDSIVPMFCGQALVTESSSIFVPSGGRKWGGGDFPLSCPPWRFSTDTFVILPSYHLTALLPYHITTLQPYHLTTLPPYHLTTLPPYNLTILQPYNLTTLPPYHLTTLPSYNLTTLPLYHLTTWPPDHQEKKCQWKKRSMSSALLHVPAGDSVLLCLVYTIVLSYMIVAYYIIIWYINYRALVALIFLCITAMWWHFFLKFSKYCLYLNVSLSLLALYIDVEAFFAICSWAMGKAVVNCKYQSGFCVCYCLYHYAPIHGSR